MIWFGGWTGIGGMSSKSLDLENVGGSSEFANRLSHMRTIFPRSDLARDKVLKTYMFPAIFDTVFFLRDQAK